MVANIAQASPGSSNGAGVAGVAGVVPARGAACPAPKAAAARAWSAALAAAGAPDAGLDPSQDTNMDAGSGSLAATTGVKHPARQAGSLAALAANGRGPAPKPGKPALAGKDGAPGQDIADGHDVDRKTNMAVAAPLAPFDGALALPAPVLSTVAALKSAPSPGSEKTAASVPAAGPAGELPMGTRLAAIDPPVTPENITPGAVARAGAGAGPGATPLPALAPDAAAAGQAGKTAVPAVPEPAPASASAAPLGISAAPKNPGNALTPESAKNMVPPVPAATPPAAVKLPGLTVAALAPVQELAAVKANASSPGGIVVAAPIATANVNAVAPALPVLVTPAATQNMAPAALAATVVALHQSGQGSTILRLDPPGLGTLAVHVALGAGGQVNVLFVPSSAQTGNLLQNSMDSLRQAMAQSGLTLGQAGVGGQSGGQTPDGRPHQNPAQFAAEPLTAGPDTPTGLSAYA